MKVSMTIADFIERAANVYGSRQGVVDEPGEFQDGGLGTQTYGAFAARARAMAAGLDELGVKRGDRVALVSQNSARLLESFFGVTTWGRVLVPINFRLASAEVEYIVEQSGATTLLVDPELEHRLRRVTARNRFLLGKESDASRASVLALPGYRSASRRIDRPGKYAQSMPIAWARAKGSAPIECNWSTTTSTTPLIAS